MKVSKRIRLYPKFSEFAARVRGEFDVELKGQESVIYSFPFGGTNIDRRVKIGSQEAYEGLKAEFTRCDTSTPVPVVLLWSPSSQEDDDDDDEDDTMSESETSSDKFQSLKRKRVASV